MSDRRKKIQGGVFRHAENAPERDSEALTQQIHGQRPPDALADIDRQQEAKTRNRFGAFMITSKGIQLNGEPDRADWQAMGAYLFQMHGALQWLLGDWLAFGEDVKWGDVPTISAAMGIEEKTLYDYTYVARHVQFLVRTEKLSFGHHKLVSRLDRKNQHSSLQYAISNRLSVNAFRRWLKGEPITPALPSPLEEDENRKAMDELWIVANSDDVISLERAVEIRQRIQTVRNWLVLLETKLPRK